MPVQVRSGACGGLRFLASSIAAWCNGKDLSPMTRGSGFNSLGRNHEEDRPTARTRGCGPRDARSTRAPPPTGAVSVTSNRARSRRADARASRVRPTSVGPRGTNSGTTHASERRRSTKPPFSADALVVQEQDAGSSSRRSACESRRGRMNRWQRSDALARKASRCRCKSCPIHRRGR